MKSLDGRLAEIENAAMRRMFEVVDIEIDAMSAEEKRHWLAQIDKDNLSAAHPLLCRILGKYNLVQAFNRLKDRIVPADLL
jgi:hypothetical protein